MKKTTMVVMTLGLLLALGAAHAKKGGQGGGGNGGGDKGGFGPLGDGCVTFLSGQGPGRFSGDGRGIYCNGTDGQISVPVRLRLDTKKFNGNKRFYWVWGECSGAPVIGDQLCDDDNPETTNGDEIAHAQMSIESDLDMQAMGLGTFARVDMGIKIDRTHFLYYDDILCNHPASPADRLWVRCDLDTNGDDLCDRWTVSTDSAFPEFTDENDSEFASNSARACLKTGAYADFIDYDVIADFTMKVCVMGTGPTDPADELYCGT